MVKEAAEGRLRGWSIRAIHQLLQTLVVLVVDKPQATHGHAVDFSIRLTHRGVLDLCGQAFAQAQKVADSLESVGSVVFKAVFADDKHLTAINVFQPVREMVHVEAVIGGQPPSCDVFFKRDRIESRR